MVCTGLGAYGWKHYVTLLLNIIADVVKVRMEMIPMISPLFFNKTFCMNSDNINTACSAGSNKTLQIDESITVSGGVEGSI